MWLTFCRFELAMNYMCHSSVFKVGIGFRFFLVFSEHYVVNAQKDFHISPVVFS